MTEGKLLGVCAWLADRFDIDVSMLRLIFVIATIVGVGSPILIYLILGCFLDSIGMVLLTVPVIFPIIVNLGAGPETGSAGAIKTSELPVLPFQPAPTLSPMMGMKFFMVIRFDCLERVPFPL